MKGPLRGFSTLEIVIALAILVSCLAAVALVSVGDQSLLIQSQVRNEAMIRARDMLASARAQSREDFRMTINQPPRFDGYFTASVQIHDALQDPFTAKRADATVSWSDQWRRLRSVTLSQILTDYLDPGTLDTCDPQLEGSWSAPSISSYAIAAGALLPATPPAGHTFGSTNTVSAADAYRGLLYVGLSKTASAGNDSLLAFKLSVSGSRPTYLGGVDTNSAVIEGPSALVALGNRVIATNTHVSNFKTCKPSANCSQLQIFDVTDPAAIPPPVNYLIPTSTAPFVTGTSSAQALGNALYYSGGLIYLGLTKTATGPEFDIIDAHDMSAPRWIGGYKIGSSINQIYVRGNYAYLATDDKSRELVILDVSDPAHPVVAATFDPLGTLGFEVGKSLYLRGKSLYVGMSAASGSPEIYSFDVSKPSIPQKLGQYVLASTAFALLERDAYLFVLASTVAELRILDITDRSSIHLATGAVRLPGQGAALDCEGNYLYVVSNAATRGSLSIIGPGT